MLTYIHKHTHGRQRPTYAISSLVTLASGELITVAGDTAVKKATYFFYFILDKGIHFEKT